MGWKCGNEHSSGCMHVAKEVYTITYQRDCKSANLFVPREHNCVIMYSHVHVGGECSIHANMGMHTCTFTCTFGTYLHCR